MKCYGLFQRGRWPLKECRVFGHDSDECYIRLCLLCGASHRGCSSCVTQRKAGVDTAVRVNWRTSVHEVVHAARDEYREGEVAEFVTRGYWSHRACLTRLGSYDDGVDKDVHWSTDYDDNRGKE